MRTETTDLVALFTKNNGGTHNWRYKDVDTSLPAETIKEACELLTTLDIFEQDGVKLFDSVLSAKFVTTIETLIFDTRLEEESSTENQEETSYPLVASVDENENSRMNSTEEGTQSNKPATKALSMDEEALPAFMVSASQLPIAPSRLSQTEELNAYDSLTRKSEHESNGASTNMESPSKQQPTQRDLRMLKGFFARMWKKQEKEDSS